nr:DNA gyrase subunit A [Clostridia bacterium]
SSGEDELLLGTRKGMCIRFNESHIRPMGRASMGVKSMKLAEDDIVIDMAPIEEGATVLAITEGGYGKRTSPDEYREQGRNGKGIRAINLTDKTGDLAALLLVQEEEDILLITDDGTIIRTPAADIRLCGRNTQGVRVMKLQEGSKVIGVARAEKEEEADVSEIVAEMNGEAVEAVEATAEDTVTEANENEI